MDFRWRARRNDHSFARIPSLAFAGLEVYRGEPNIHKGYCGLEDSFLLPHMGTSTLEARDQMGFAALVTIDAVLAGREPPFPVV